jgi:hypothetical protein
MPKLPLSSNRREDRIAQRLLAKTWQFPFLFYEAKRICLHLLKVAGAVENLKTLSGSSPVFVLSYHTTFSQTQTGATVPLNKLLYYFHVSMLWSISAHRPIAQKHNPRRGSRQIQ